MMMTPSDMSDVEIMDMSERGSAIFSLNFGASPNTRHMVSHTSLRHASFHNGTNHMGAGHLLLFPKGNT